MQIGSHTLFRHCRDLLSEADGGPGNLLWRVEGESGGMRGRGDHQSPAGAIWRVRVESPVIPSHIDHVLA